MISGAMVAYILAFVLLYPMLGPGVMSLSGLPVIVAGSSLGLRSGLLAGLLLFPLNTLLLNLTGQAGVDVVVQVGGLPGSVVGVVLGGVIGRLSDLREQIAREQAALRVEIVQRKRAEEAERLPSQELESLVSIARSLTQPESFVEKSSRVLEELVRITNGNCVVLRLFDEKQKGLLLVATAGAGRLREVSELLFPLQRGLVGLAFQQGQPIIANDYRAFREANPRLLEHGVRSVVALPIQVDGHRLGVITVRSLELDHFTPERVRLVTAVANGIGALLENARLYHEMSSDLDRESRRLEAFRTAARRLAIEENPEQGLHQFVDLARELGEASYGALALWDRQDHVMTWLVSGVSVEEQRVLGAPVEGQGLLGLVRDVKKSIRLNDLSGNAKFMGLPSNHPPVKSFLSTPIICRGRRSGALYLANKEEDTEFSVEDERLLSLFAALAGVHLENASLYEEVARERGTQALRPGQHDGGPGGDRPGWDNSLFQPGCGEAAGIHPWEGTGQADPGGPGYRGAGH